MGTLAVDMQCMMVPGGHGAGEASVGSVLAMQLDFSVCICPLATGDIVCQVVNAAFFLYLLSIDVLMTQGFTIKFKRCKIYILLLLCIQKLRKNICIMNIHCLLTKQLENIHVI